MRTIVPVPEQPSVTAASDVSTSAAIMAVLSAADADRLTGPGVDTPDWPGFHCTLGYIADVTALGPDVQGSVLDALAPLAAAMPATADAFASAHFNPDDEDRDPCAVVLVQSTELAELHDGVTDAIASLIDPDTAFPIWIPHCTVAYNADPSVIPAGVVGTPLTFDRLVIGWGDQQITVGDQQPATPGPAGLAAAATEAPVTAPTTDTPPDTQPAPTETVGDPYAPGTQWAGPLVVLDKPTADGRVFTSAGLTIRDLPLPLSFQREGTHGGEMPGTTTIVGRILTAEIRDGALYGTGDWLDPAINFDVAEAAQRVQGGLGMVSGDTAPTVIEYGAVQDDGQTEGTGPIVAVDPMLYEGDSDDLVMVAAEWEFMGATLVADPAFGATRIAAVGEVLIPATGDPGEVPAPTMLADGANPTEPVVTAEQVTFPDGTAIKVGDTITATSDDGTVTGTVTTIDPDAGTVALDVDGSDPVTFTVDQLQPTSSDTAAGLQAAGAPHRYPAEWFEPVALDGPTGITVTDDGRVYGHLALTDSCHTGFADQCVTPPSSATGYAYFHLGEVDTTAGPLAVGKLTVGGGHADPKSGWRGTVEHYDNAGATAAVVRAHEDEYGIQVTGAIVPTANDHQVAALRRSPLSGDWRRIGGNLELVAALSVNVPGFPVPRAALAASGEQTSLVAAGVVHAEPAEVEPETTGAVTLPSGVQLTSVDVAVLASAFDLAATKRAARLASGEALRGRLRADRDARLRAKLGVD